MNLIDKVFITPDILKLLKQADIDVPLITTMPNQIRIFETVLALYEMYGVYIEVSLYTWGKFYYVINTKYGDVISSELIDDDKPQYFKTPSKAYLAGIKYTLKELIKTK